jgi:hypothetical protein
VPRSPSPLVTWPVKAHQLAEIVESSGTDLVRIVWASWLKQPSSRPLSVTWTPNAKGAIGGGFGEAGLTIWVRPVDRADPERLRAMLATAVVPELLAWIKSALEAGEAWQGTHHERTWFCEAGSLTAQDRDGFHRAEMRLQP